MRTSTLRADGLLLLAAAIWGSGFVAQRAGMEHVGPLTFTGVRFIIGTLVLLPLLLIPATGSQQSQSAPLARRSGFIGTILAGVVLFLGATLQQIGLVDTTAGKGGFITGLYVVFVPLIGVFIRHRIPPATWVGAALAVVGLYFLSVTEALTINPGDVYVLGCALVWAVHVLIIGWLSPRVAPFRLAAGQFAVAAVLGTAVALLYEQWSVADLLAARWAILYSGVFSIGVAFTLQIMAQRHAPPAHAAILLSLEAVFAALFGGLLLGETLTTRQFAGCGLLLAAMLITQVRRPSAVPAAA